MRNSPLWKQSLLIILSDEHGGIYDHVSPPSATNPDGKNATDPVFQFDRLGVRIPAVLVSPYIPKGMIDNEHDAAVQVRDAATRFLALQ